MSKRQYIITLDLHRKVESFFMVDLNVSREVKSLISEFQSYLQDNISTLLPRNSEVLVINMVELAREILVKANCNFYPRMRDALVVSTCAEIAEPNCGFQLEINRIINFNGDKIGHGPRPTFPTLHQQFDTIKQMSDFRPVVIVEDGSFQGETLDYVVAELQKREVKVDLLAIGFAFPSCIDLISRRGVKVVTSRDVVEPIDWMPDHDFLPFLPGCGKVVGLRLNGECYPFYTSGGYTLATPYIFPYCPKMSDWIGLPDADIDQLKWLSQTAHNFSLKIFSCFEEGLGRKIIMQDLMPVKPPVSFPHISGTKHGSDYGTRRVIDCLSSFSARIW